MSSTNKTNYSYTKSEIDSMGGGTSLSDAISQKANDSDVVHKNGNETINGTKIFSNSPRVVRTAPDIALNISDCDVTEIPTDNKEAVVFFRDKNGKILSYVVGQRRTTGANRICVRAQRTDINGYYSIDLDTDGNFYPENNNAINLGNSTNKWKTINGLNPGSLSLPSISTTGANAWIALDTTDWVKEASASASQKYIPLADGWLNVRVDNAILLAIAVGGNYMHQMIRSETPNSLALLMPVFKGEQVAIIVGGNENLAYNRVTFYYCQGNV